MKKNLLLTLILVFFQNLSGQSPLLRYPAISPDGQQVAFSYEGDIWTVATDGGQARRLTIHEAYEAWPVWSRDGERIAFTGDRYRQGDLFVMDADGGNPQRLTWHGAADVPWSWGPDDSIYFNSRRLFVEVERNREIQIVSADGGTPYRVMDAVGDRPALSPDGRYLAFERGHCRIEREAYTGPAQRDIWLYDRQEDKFIQMTDHEAMDIYPRWDAQGNLFFLSARSGRYNIYRINPGDIANPEAKAEGLTGYRDEGIRWFDASYNGERLVFEYGTGFYLLDTRNGDISRLEIDVSSDNRFEPLEYKTMTREATDFAISPNGKLLALTIRGELFVTRNDKEKTYTTRLTNHPWRDQEPVWLSDTTLLFISDREGQKDIYFLQADNAENSDLLSNLKFEIKRITKSEDEESDLRLSPDNSKLAFVRNNGTLVVAEVDSDGSLKKEKALVSGWATPEGLTWSPDGKWLAYSMDDLDFNEEVYIQSADGRDDPVNISLHPRGDSDPVWSADGRKLGFLSIRNNGDQDVWFVWLRKEDWEKTQQDWKEAEVLDEPKNGNGENDKDSTVSVVIDFDDIHERLVQVTRLPGNEYSLQVGPKGEYFYFFTNGGSRQGSGGDNELVKIKWDGSDQEVLKGKINRPGRLTLEEESGMLYFLQNGGSISRISTDGGNPEGISFAARMTIDYPSERQQIFDEAWRALRDYFYDPSFHGKDFTKLREKYEARAVQASTDRDFRDMFNEMLGQLNASHMGMYGSDRGETQDQEAGLLGVELKPTKVGLVVTRVLPGSPADRSDSRLVVGDRITAVNGRPVETSTNIYELLNNTAGQRTILSISGLDGQDREVIIRPANALGSELYDNWVDERRRLTEEYSGGRLGYIHIRGMNWTSFERFERELTASGLGKEGIVIDVRWNGGGWTTDMLMAVLNVRQHAYTIPRGAADNLEKQHRNFREHYPYGERLPLSAWTRPSIALCNEASYSNAEIFSHAFKTLDIGTLVGQPTFGAVISTGGQRLINGFLVRMPFRAWYVKSTDENMEHGPAVPDLLVEQAPDSKANDSDPQLKAAVNQLLKEIAGD